MQARIDLKLTLKRKTSESVLAIVGMLAAVADPTMMGDTPPEEVSQIKTALTKGFSAPMVSNAEDGSLVYNRDFEISPSFFQQPDWERLFCGLMCVTNITELTDLNAEVPVHFDLSGTSDTAPVETWLALIRFLREHMEAPKETVEILRYRPIDDPEGAVHVVTLNEKLQPEHSKHVGDIVMPLDLRWDLESPYAANAEAIMRDMVAHVREVTNHTTQQLSLKANAGHKVFIQQTGVNKLLLAYYAMVSYAVKPTPETLPPEFQEAGGDEDDYEVVFIHPGLVTILGDLVGMALMRIAKSGVLGKTAYKGGKPPFGNRAKLREIETDLPLLFPSAKAEPVREMLANYLSISRF